MKSVMRITLITTLLFMLFVSSVYAAPEQRTALVIGNGAYSSGPLKNPVNDATDMSAILKKLGFSVTLKSNSSLQEMEDAIEAFGNLLKRGGVGLFYYAGHGVQVNGTNYLLPIGARINKEADVKYQAVDANKILDEMAAANNGLNIVMLDACRDNPFTRSFRSAARGLAIVSSAPSGTFISYSTSPGNVARDGDGRNSPYTAALLQYMQAPGQTISDVFINVRTKVKKETGQVPWELSSLEGRFYFAPQDSTQNNQPDVPSYAAKFVPLPESEEVLRQKAVLEREKKETERQQALDAELKRLLESARTSSTSAIPTSNAPSYLNKSTPRPESDESVRQKEALERERQDLARERQDLERQRALDTEREQLAVERRKIEVERQQLAMGKRPSVSTALETARDGRFIAYDNGTVLDTQTNLMWAAKDNGNDINWNNAKSYCGNYREGGYTDWRLPTQDELAGLYDSSKSYTATQLGHKVHLTELIKLSTCCPWTSQTRIFSDVANFSFDRGSWRWNFPSQNQGLRALPVRNAK